MSSREVGNHKAQIRIVAGSLRGRFSRTPEVRGRWLNRSRIAHPERIRRALAAVAAGPPVESILVDDTRIARGFQEESA